MIDKRIKPDANSSLSFKVNAMAVKIVDDAVASGQSFTAKMCDDAIDKAIAHFCKK